MYPTWDNYDKLLVFYYKFLLKTEVALRCEVSELSFVGPKLICFQAFFSLWWILPFVFNATFFLQPHYERVHYRLAQITYWGFEGWSSSQLSSSFWWKVQI